MGVTNGASPKLPVANSFTCTRRRPPKFQDAATLASSFKESNPRVQRRLRTCQRDTSGSPGHTVVTCAPPPLEKESSELFSSKSRRSSSAFSRLNKLPRKPPRSAKAEKRRKSPPRNRLKPHFLHD